MVCFVSRQFVWPLTSSPCARRRLPYSTSEKDIIDFFEGYPVLEVAFVYEPDGRPSGLVSTRDAPRPPA
jgi:hypothetical protein